MGAKNAKHSYLTRFAAMWQKKLHVLLPVLTFLKLQGFEIYMDKRIACYLFFEAMYAWTAKQSVFLRIQVRASSRTKGLEQG